MSVRAKFRVDGIVKAKQPVALKNDDGSYKKDENGNYQYEEVELTTVAMYQVYSSDPASENAKFWAATPAGQLQLGTINPAAASQFELHREYYVDFTPVP